MFKILYLTRVKFWLLVRLLGFWGVILKLLSCFYGAIVMVIFYDSYFLIIRLFSEERTSRLLNAIKERGDRWIIKMELE